MPADIAPASTNSPNVWPTGSSAYRLTPVEVLAAGASAMCRSNLLGVGPDAAAALFPPNPKSTSQRSLSRPLPLRKTITSSDISALAHQLAPNQRAPGDQPPVCGIAENAWVAVAYWSIPVGQFATEIHPP